MNDDVGATFYAPAFRAMHSAKRKAPAHAARTHAALTDAATPPLKESARGRGPDAVARGRGRASLRAIVCRPRC